jgi:hypothetical protein
MTTFQRELLTRFFATGEDFWFAGGWVTAREIRRDRRLASAMYWELLAR